METMLQFFEWNLPDDSQLWNQVKEAAQGLREAGFTKVWLPPAYKGQAGRTDTGYGVYDMYDLGEFNAKGTVKTKYGARQEYLDAVNALRNAKIDVVADIVFNHRMGSDATETIQATNMNWQNRNEPTGQQHQVEVWTKYTFPERNNKYSSFTWDWNDFTGTDYDQATGDKNLLQFEGKSWNENVSREQGNFDFIMGDDVDFNEKEVVEELCNWGRWYVQTARINAFRLDAVKSIDSTFFPGWLKAMEKELGKPAYAVGEFWTQYVQELDQYLEDCGHSMALFDVPLHYHFMQAGQSNGGYDLRNIWRDTLTDHQPGYACAFVDNHDTQPGQALESWVPNWFKPQAYAMILLRSQPCPCVFYGDLYGMKDGSNGPVPFLWDMVWIRRNLLSNELTDYWTDDPQMLAWLVRGEHPVFVILTEGDWKQYTVQEPDIAGRTFVDITDPDHKVTVNENGEGTFTCRPGSLGIYVTEEDWARRGEGQIPLMDPVPAQAAEVTGGSQAGEREETDPERFVLSEPSMAGQVFVDITDPGRRVVADERGEAVFERGDGPAGVFVTEEQWNRFGGQ
ncbi:alpha-amylase [Faecalibaculum rodentium]|uniref:alpha-amylase n=1 Tax=Faecalibaculum rodentium TaxID=1702221 RepID=UPI0023F457E2|nr:alpha-amylase [Faecalibaculum rodentium]